MKPILVKAIVLDLFDTLVKWEPGRLPEFVWHGKAGHSTMPLLLGHLRQTVPEWHHDDVWLDAYNAVMLEIADERSSRGIEVTCTERFIRTVARLPLPEPAAAEPLAAALRAVHMDAVRQATSAPPANLAAVHRLAAHYRLGLLSNFDDAETGRQIIADTGVAHLFEAVIISAEVALRKPNPLIFKLMLEMLDLKPEEVLFVGDTLHEDVLGAQAAGIPVVWLSHNRGEIPTDMEAPALIVPTLAELPAALGL
jgi:FMN phosphatase YigB (HAD superfamily)